MRNLVQAIFVSACFVTCTISFGCESPHSSARDEPPAFEVIQTKILQGDIAFKEYDYRSALKDYEQADRWISALIDFEIYSSLKEKNPIAREAKAEEKRRLLEFHVEKGILQRYQNTKTFIRARIELAKIAMIIEPDSTSTDLDRR